MDELERYRAAIPAMDDDTLIAMFCDLEIMDLDAHLAGNDVIFDLFTEEIQRRGLTLDA